MRLFNDNELSGGAPAGADTINDGGNTAPLDNTNGGDTQKAENANDNNGGDINGSENASGKEEGAEEAEA